MSKAITAGVASESVEGDRCPNCGDVVANVQGIADCTTCVWTAD
jgi:hypothetical protein